MLTPDEARAQLQAAGRYLLRHDLTWGNSGNLSARLRPDHILITASGTRLGELDDDDFVICPLAASPADAYTRKPSKETPTHAAVYQARPDVGAVLHASPFYSMLVACTDAALPAGLFVEAMYYLERVARVAYAHPGSIELGDLVGQQATQANILILENHGVLVYDTSVPEALMGLHTLEIACRMVVEAGRAGLQLRSLPPATVSDFLTRAGYRPRRQWPGEV